MKFTSNIVPLIKEQLQNDKVDLKIFSPYLTGSAALEIAQLGKSAKVYTLVNVQVLASGASNCDTIKTLLDNEIPVYVLPKLHAKMVVARDRFVTLGSQNFTERGATANLETNIRVRGVSKGVQALVAKMERQATLLTPGFLESVNKAAQVLVGKYDALREQADKLDRDLIAAEKSRASAQRGERAIDAEVRSELAKRPQSNPRKCSIVSRFDEKYARLQHSLKGEELLTWPIGKKTHDLKPQHRYLCISGAGKLGWVRVNKTVYSFIENRIGVDRGQIKGQAQWGVAIDASDKACKAKKGDYNLRVAVIDREDKELCHVFMRYNTEDLDVYPAVMLRNSGKPKAPADERRKAVEWIDANTESFARDIKRLITTPFKFEENLTGERADKFFGAEGTSHTLCLVKLRSNVALRVLEPEEEPAG
ncbi:phospholipase D family protein [Pseudomonas sp. B21-032]|uniref:phospholipase D family protein n=1 Tax=Pseudomonas sp. B21-032 TaxID=2895483 RepID=UPI00215FD581|nr:phospholipase D family protein [Pseudomonas sp. B21-032]UVL59805.1 phospholipase D family protein [Pseudomonas sp. B21-032]